ncbi:MAG: GNAT family N-acetyltransferase [Clostridia bacterium]
MNILIKEFEKKYHSQLMNLIQDVLNEYDFTFDVGDIKSDINQLKDHKSYTKSAEKFWVALDSEKLIGSIAIRDRKDDELAELKRFYLLPEYRGLGIGSKLYNIAEKFAKENNFTGIWLESSRKFKSASILYKRKGFILIEELDNDWEDNLYQKIF